MKSYSSSRSYPKRRFPSGRARPGRTLSVKWKRPLVSAAPTALSTGKTLMETRPYNLRGGYGYSYSSLSGRRRRAD